MDVALAILVFGTLLGIIVGVVWARSARIRLMKGYAESRGYSYAHGDAEDASDAIHPVLDSSEPPSLVNNVVRGGAATATGTVYLGDKRDVDGNERQTVCVLRSQSGVNGLVQVRRRCKGALLDMNAVLHRRSTGLTEVNVAASDEFIDQFAVLSDRADEAHRLIDRDVQQRLLQLLSHFGKLPIIVLGIKGDTLAVATRRLWREDDLQYLEDFCGGLAAKLRSLGPTGTEAPSARVLHRST